MNRTNRTFASFSFAAALLLCAASARATIYCATAFPENGNCGGIQPCAQSTDGGKTWTVAASKWCIGIPKTNKPKSVKDAAPASTTIKTPVAPKAKPDDKAKAGDKTGAK